MWKCPAPRAYAVPTVFVATLLLSFDTPTAAAAETTVFDAHVGEATILRRDTLQTFARDVTAVTTYTQMGVTVSAFGTNTVPGQVHFVSYCEDKALAFREGSYVLDRSVGAIRSAASWGPYAVSTARARDRAL